MFLKKLLVVLILVHIASTRIDEDDSNTTVRLVAIIGGLVGLVIMVAAGLVVISFVYRCVCNVCVVHIISYYIFVLRKKQYHLVT